MSKYFKRYRIPSARKQNWDYTSNAAYFVTICTAGRVCYFGDIINGKMHLSDIGEIANKFFGEIPHHFPNVHLNAYVVMPNHVHGIIIMDKPFYGNPDTLPDNPDRTIVKTPNLGASTTDTCKGDTGTTDTCKGDTGTTDTCKGDTGTTDTCKGDTGKGDTGATNMGNGDKGPMYTGPITKGLSPGPISSGILNNNWKPGAIGVIINQYKRICTLYARKINMDFAWQSRYYDIIVQNEKSFFAIRKYIIKNPENWDTDNFH